MQKGSKSIVFRPAGWSEKGFRTEISTAGSVGLVVQSVAPILAKRGGKGFIRGGATYGKWAPSIHYLQKVILPLVFQESNLKILRHGFYPKGDAKTILFAEKTDEEIDLVERGGLKEVKGISVASQDLKGVEKRQADAATELISSELGLEPDFSTMSVKSSSPGSGVLVWAETEHSILGGDCVGEKGKKAEKVGREAAGELLTSLKKGAVDEHAADQLIPFLTINGGRIKVPEVTSHCETNIWVCNHFLEKEIKVKDNRISCQLSRP